MKDFKYLQNLIKNPPNNIPRKLNRMRDTIFNFDGDEELIINLVLDTEMKAYLLDITDFDLQKEDDFSSDLDLVIVDQRVRENNSLVEDPSLSDIVNSHYSSIYRIAAFACDYVVRLDRIVNG